MELLYVGLESVSLRFSLRQVILLYSSVCPCQQAGMLYDDQFQVCGPRGRYVVLWSAADNVGYGEICSGELLWRGDNCDVVVCCHGDERLMMKEGDEYFFFYTIVGRGCVLFVVLLSAE